ncbi:hypothetical protein JTB14_003738 [Gonioctena quinquepunctata]|nr:hypothetical protein JTB14_003738 [Gonioctena quinquepunctata]
MEPADFKDISSKNDEVSQVSQQDDNKKDQQSEKGDEDDDYAEEDIPGDFFDDFLKEDFMAGLDIVDEDEGDEEKDKDGTNGHDKTSKMKRIRRKSPTKDKRRKARRERRKDDIKEDNKRKDEKRNRKSREKVINADDFDIRRDPKKTRRDIERDKAKCDKDKEKKIITEKLKLVETGLVPPGMEMEIDMEELNKQKEELDQMDKTKSRSPKKRSRSKEKISPRRRKSRSPRKTNSPRRRSPIRRMSPRRSPRRTSPRRSPRRSPIRRSRDRSIGRAILRRSRSHSPYYRNRRSRYSPSHNRPSPERDLYGRHRRSRSRSVKRRREEKKSFLQEIAEKLNETRPPVNMMPVQHLQPHASEVYHMNSQPVQQLPIRVVPPPVPAPAPVPPPMMASRFPIRQNHPQNMQQQYDPYDQSFFIGTPQPNQVVNYGAPSPQLPHPIQHPVEHQVVNYGAPSPQLPHSIQQPVEPVESNQNSNVTGPSQSHPNLGIPTRGLPRRIETKEDIAKLFKDKKITLTEFLSITTKPEIYSECSAHIQEKIKVISRCQDAIKILGNSEKKFTGPLVVRKSEKPKTLQEKFKSPLMKFLQLRIPFTDIPKKDQQRSAFTNYINYLLQTIGLMNEIVVEIDDQDAPSSTDAAKGQEEATPPPPPQISHNHVEVPTRRPNLKNSNQLSKFVQTDLLKCHECDKRKNILYRSSGVQCGGEQVTYSVSTQVKEDDFYVKIPKNQSLASLTPAQLLAKSGSGSKYNRSVEVDDFDLLFSSNNSRTGFGRGSETYGMSRYNPPSPTPRFFPPTREEPKFSLNPLSSLGGREDGAYCKFCFVFAQKEVGHTSAQITGHLVTDPYRNWKKALENFQKHQTTQYHCTASIKADNFLSVMAGKSQSINSQVDAVRARQVKENQEKLVPIIKTVILCGRQGLPLRGHRDHGMFNISVEPEENEGNFRALLRARIDSRDVNLKKHFETCPRNATYISWNIQNQIIEACDIIIKRKIASEVNCAKCFSILSDETTDISTIEQCSICIRIMVQLLKPVHAALQEISLCKDKDSSSEKLLGYSLPLAKILQLENSDLAFAMDKAKETISTIKYVRENAKAQFKNIFDEAKQIADMFDVEIKIPRLASKQANRANVPAERFQKEYFGGRTVSVVPKIQQNKSSTKTKNALDALNLCNPDIYPNVFIILVIFATLPISTSSLERSFSTLRRLKSYLRNTTSENRLNGLAHLSIHKEIHVDPKDVMAVLKDNGPRRLDFLL